MELGDDEELDPTDAELEAEAEAEPGMMRDAGYWDDFLNLVDIMQEPWAAPEAEILMSIGRCAPCASSMLVC